MPLPDFEALDRYAECKLDETKTPGVCVGIAYNGVPIAKRTYGYRQLEPAEPVTEDTVFGIGSITKSMTALAILKLEELGRLSVDDVIVKYIPEFRTSNQAWAEATTIHHFLTHTSGLPLLNTEKLGVATSLTDEELQPHKADLDRYGTIDTYEDLLHFIADSDEPLLGPPGEYFSYCNEAFCLLGLLIERVSGKSYEEFVKEYIFDPAGMTRTTFSPGDLKNWDNVTMIYVRKQTEQGAVVVASPNWMYGLTQRSAGACTCSTVGDMLRFMEIFRTLGTVQGKRIVSEDRVKRMTQPHASISQNAYYGYGLMIHRNFRGEVLIRHGGGAKGVNALVGVLPERGYTFVSLSNLASAAGAAIGNGVLNLLTGYPVDGPLEDYPEVAASTEEISNCAGRYRSRKQRLTFVQEAGTLYFVTGQGQGRDPSKIALRPAGGDQYLMGPAAAPTVWRFVRDRTNRVVGVQTALRMFTRVAESEGEADELSH